MAAKRAKIEFEVMGEDGKSEMVKSLIAARNLKDIYQKEGKFVQIIKYEETIFGRIGKEWS
jgi:hypothetical protein